MRTSDDEIGELVDVFNAMLDELGRRALTLEQANRALRQSDERYQLAVRGSSAGLWDWDTAGRHDVLFAPLQGIAGLQRGGIPRPCRRRCTDVMHEEDRPAVQRGAARTT